MLKQLTASKFDRGNCRLYVHDHAKKPYVLLDQGPSYARAGLQRFELFTHTRSGEPDCPINNTISWELVNGVAGTDFPTGLKYSANTGQGDHKHPIQEQKLSGKTESTL